METEDHKGCPQQPIINSKICRHNGSSLYTEHYTVVLLRQQILPNPPFHVRQRA